ncbi:MAG: insulinase family protein [Acidobacteria bacterium]|nr:insulinase family protein [Acidobacteriota bacterium]
MSSRLYQSLVYGNSRSQEASFNLDNKVDGGLLYFLAIGSEGKTSAELEKSLLEELKLIQTKGVTPSELAKAKNQLIADAVESLEDNDGKAIAVERSIAYEGNPNLVNTSVARLQAVTAADVLRVMKKYFTDTNRVVIHYSNDGGAK